MSTKFVNLGLVISDLENFQCPIPYQVQALSDAFRRKFELPVNIVSPTKEQPDSLFEYALQELATVKQGLIRFQKSDLTETRGLVTSRISTPT